MSEEECLRIQIHVPVKMIESTHPGDSLLGHFCLSSHWSVPSLRVDEYFLYSFHTRHCIVEEINTLRVDIYDTTPSEL